MIFSKIQTERLELIPITEEHCNAELSLPVLEVLLEARIPEAWPPELVTEGVVSEFIQLLTSPGGSRFFAYYWVKTDKHGSDKRVLVGSGGFMVGDDGVLELGYSVIGEFQGHGYATEAVRAMIEWAFTFFDNPSIYAATFPKSFASIRVLEKTGFMHAGPGRDPETIAYLLNKIL